MKKLLLCLVTICSFVFITGCTSKEVSLNLEDLSNKLDNLKNNQFDRFSATQVIESKIANLEAIYDYDFEEKFGFTNENIENYSVGINESNMDVYFLVKPKDGKKEDVKKEIDHYFESLEKNQDEKIANKAKEKSYIEVQGYLVYVMADQSDEILEEIKNCRENVFGALSEINDEMLFNQFDINKEDVEDYLIKTPMMITSSNSYIIIKPKDGKKEEIKEKMNSYMEKLEKQWEIYLVDQYELVKNRLEEEYGDYLIYIISSDNELVFDTIKANNLA